MHKSGHGVSAPEESLHAQVKTGCEDTYLSRMRLDIFSTVAEGCDSSFSKSFATVRFLSVKLELVIEQTKSSEAECAAGCVLLACAPKLGGGKAGGMAEAAIPVVGKAGVFIGSKALCVAGNVFVGNASNTLCVPPKADDGVLDGGNANADGTLLDGNALAVAVGKAGTAATVAFGKAGTDVPKGAEGAAAKALGKLGAAPGKLGTGAACDGKMAELELPCAPDGKAAGAAWLNPAPEISPPASAQMFMASTPFFPCMVSNETLSPFGMSRESALPVLSCTHSVRREVGICSSKKCVCVYICVCLQEKTNTHHPGK